MKNLTEQELLEIQGGGMADSILDAVVDAVVDKVKDTLRNWAGPNA